MSVLDKRVYDNRNGEIDLNEFTKSGKIVGNKGKVKYLINDVLYKLNMDEKQTYQKVFAYNVLSHIMSKINKLYDQEMMVIVCWFIQQVLIPNRKFRIPLVRISKYFVKKKVYEEYLLMADILISNAKVRPFVNHSIYMETKGGNIDQLVDYIILTYELTTGKICNKKDIEKMIFNIRNKIYLIFSLGKNIQEEGFSMLFKSYIYSKPDIEFNYRELWRKNKSFLIGLLSIQFTKFMLNSEGTDNIFNNLACFV